MHVDEADLALAEELFARSAGIVDLSPSQLEGFVSGLFAVWETDDEALAFIELCRRQGGPRAAALCAGVAELDSGQIGARARQAADAMASSLPENARRLGSARAMRAWQIDAPFGQSIVLGCGTATEGADHSVLVELADAMLVDLHLAGEPEELLEAALASAGALDIVDVAVDEAIELIAAAWRRAAGRLEPTPTVLANQHVVRRRLGSAANDLPLFTEAGGEVDTSRGMTEHEIQDADRSAVSTIKAALGPVPDSPVHQAWEHVVRGLVPALTPREREGLLWLEWADWLGVGIGLARGLDGDDALSGETFVDLVNRCPEVSSTVHADDRDYAIWAFEIALDHLRDCGLVVDGRLTSEARAGVYPSLLRAWGGQ